MSNIGKRINTLRKERNMTQKELAENLHVSDKLISKWELGYSEPDIDAVLSLAKIFDVSVSQLLGENEEPAITTQPKKDINTRVKGFFKRNYMTIIQLVLIYIGLIFCMASMGYYMGYDLVREILPTGLQVVFLVTTLLFAFLQTFCTLVDPGRKSLTTLKIILFSLCVIFVICCFSFYGKLDGLAHNDNQSYPRYFAFSGGGYLFFMLALLFNLLIDIRVIKTNAPLKFEKVFFIIVLCFLSFESCLLATNIVTGAVAYAEEYSEQTTAREIDFEDGDITLYDIGQTYQLEVVFRKQERPEKVLYRSSNEAVATVDENGLVTAVAAGSCNIIATLESNPEIETRCYVYVAWPTVAVVDYPGFDSDVGYTPASFYWGEIIELTCRIDNYSNFDNLDSSRFSYNFVSSEFLNEDAVVDGEVIEVSDIENGIFTIKFIINSSEADEVTINIIDDLSYIKRLIYQFEFDCYEANIRIYSQTFKAGQQKELRAFISTTYPEECVYEVTSGENVAEFIGKELYIKTCGTFEVTITTKFGVSASEEFTVSERVTFSPDDLSSFYDNTIRGSKVINFTFDDEFAVTDKIEAEFSKEGIAELRYENGQYVIYALADGVVDVTFTSHGYSTRSYRFECVV